ncbi:hypothetical protein GCM10008986_20330 [Salinibacillus aidingensis]|uniref:Uncharacterized protein n=1 Tax=Salinibacillus aidingensis TaxID=237684 RepID=A0ABN1BAP5_9BACI
MKILRALVFVCTIGLFLYAVIGTLIWDYDVPLYGYGALLMVSVTSVVLEKQVQMSKG